MDNNDLVMYETDEQPSNALQFAVVNTVNATDLKTQLIVANALNNAYSLNDCVQPDEILNVVDLIVVPTYRNEDGRKVPCEGTYIVCSDGAAYYSQSYGIARSAKLLAACTCNRLGKDTPNGFLRVQLCVKSTNGRTYKTLKTII